jgi:NADH-quinone oxidoreductase subunit J
MVQTVVFLIFSFISLGAAFVVVTTRNLFHSALFLILSFVGVAGLYVLLEAPFLAAIQILIYIGAISVLIVFAIMLTRRLMAEDLVQRNAQWALSALVAMLLFGGLSTLLIRINWPVVKSVVPEGMITMIGQDLVGTYMIPFEVTSVLLLAALIGSIVVARERE